MDFVMLIFADRQVHTCLNSNCNLGPLFTRVVCKAAPTLDQVYARKAEVLSSLPLL
jgi:hypothetical protein